MSFKDIVGNIRDREYYGMEKSKWTGEKVKVEKVKRGWKFNWDDDILSDEMKRALNLLGRRK